MDMKRRLIRLPNLCLLALALFPAGFVAVSQENSSRVHSKHDIAEIVRELEFELKEPSKAASGILEKRLDSSTQVAARTKDGRAEYHADFDDVFFVLSGQATLVTGGTIVNPTGQIEIRGDSVRGGTKTLLAPGDLVHIPCSTPHQLLISPGHDFAYTVIKLRCAK